MKTKNRNPFRDSDPKQQSPGLTTTIVASAFVIIMGILVFVALPHTVEILIAGQTRLTPGTEAWDKWPNISVPIYLKFYIFNVTNSDAVQHNGSKYEMAEVGPYVYEEKRTKIITGFSDEEDSVTYQEIRTHFFRPDLSVGSVDDIVDIANIPYIAVATLLTKHLHGVPSLANYVMDYFVDDDEGLVLRGVRVGDLIFDGVQLPSIYDMLAEFELIPIPPEYIEGKFAIMHGKNGTPSKNYEVNRGIKDTSSFGKIMRYDNMDHVTSWTDPSFPLSSVHQFCNQINGSDGSLVPPFIQKRREERIYIFMHEICRSIYFEFEKELDYEGIPAFSYTMPASLFEHPDVNPENQCFCQDPGFGMDKSCSKGAFRIFSCKQDVPLVTSKPHFLDGSESLINGVIGMRPNRSLHDSQFSIEPTTGHLLDAHGRLQVNVELQPLGKFPPLKNTSRTIVPVFWLELQGSVEEKDLADLRLRLVTPLKILNILQWIVIGSFISLIPLGLLITLKNKIRLKRSDTQTYSAVA